jgi:hypothetical protein
MKTVIFHLVIWVLLTGCAGPTASLLSKEFDYRLTHNGSFIFFRGGIDFGLADDLSALMERSPGIQGIVLDSYGGRVYAARDAAEVISKHKLNTYAPRSCKSACTILFLAGKQRHLGEGAVFHFHRYGVISHDIKRFKDQGVSTEFLNRLSEELKTKEWVSVSNAQAVKARIVVEQTALENASAVQLAI